MLGFETIGNATLTVFDDIPILTTDPWIKGKPYFGSWAHKFNIPKKQIENIENSKYIWLSHGHPDHIDPESLYLFENKTILIPDHYGERIFNDLKHKYKCVKINSNSWFDISKNVRIKSFADWNQDACLLIEINKTDIILNLNDGSGLGWSKTIKEIIKNYKNRFLLKLINWGDADMINIYNHHNEFILPLAAEQKPCGETYSYYMKKWNCNFAIPFSSFHTYEREDSIKMNNFVTPLSEHYKNFNNSHGEMLPAFIIWDSTKETYFNINPKINTGKTVKPEFYGDNWSDILDKNDKILIEKYFLGFDHLKNKFGFISFNVGNKDFNILYTGPNGRVAHEMILDCRPFKANGIEAGGSTYDWAGCTVNAGAVTTFQRHALVSENRVTVLPDTLDLREATLRHCQSFLDHGYPRPPVCRGPAWSPSIRSPFSVSLTASA